MSATARAATARPATVRRHPTPARATARRRPVLTEVPAAPVVVAGAGVFALVVVGLLVAGMGVLLVLNTSLAQGAFEIGALSQTKNQLAVQEQHLLQEVALAESPEALQRRASTLGMVPVAAPVFLRLADGVVLGTPAPATAPTRGERSPGLPSTGGRPATSSARAAGSSDAAVADAAPQTDAAVADTSRSGSTR